MKLILYSALGAAIFAASAKADVVSICNDTMDTCLVHKTQSFGTFENAIRDNYPEEYAPGYLHAGMYCAAGNWHHGWLMPWEQSPIIKPSCGR